jgi:hypothetical protein
MLDERSLRKLDDSSLEVFIGIHHAWSRHATGSGSGRPESQPESDCRFSGLRCNLVFVVE